MTQGQQVHYRKRLWPAACKAQGWEVSDEAKRREITEETTGQATTSGLNNKQVDRLFRRLEWLADPGNFDAAYLDANTEIADELSAINRVTKRIENDAERAGFNEAYLAKAAEHKVRTHAVQTWRQLPYDELVNFAKTVTSRARGKRRASPVQGECTSGASGAPVMPF